VSATNLFGPIVTGKNVRTAMLDTVRRWFPTYVAELSRLDERAAEALPLFRSYASALDMPDGRFVEEQMPSCVVVAPGLITEPERHGGFYVATWAVSVGAVISGQNKENTFDLAELYAATIRAIVVQNGSLGGFATATDWLGERYDDIPNEMSRTLAAGTVQFAVEVQRAINPKAGPDEPLADPLPDPGPRGTFAVVDSTIAPKE
jgi:hypothetical protein